MLRLIAGTHEAEKRSYIYDKVASLTDSGKDVVMIVPEPANFNHEKMFLLAKGDIRANKVTITSFSHLIRDLLADEGLCMKPAADTSARNGIMSLACDAVAPSLSMYSSHKRNSELVASLLSQYSEIKQAGFDTPMLEKLSKTLPDGTTLKQKTGELSAIFSAYEALIGERFSDKTDNIPLATDFLTTHDFFRGKYVFVYDFRGITGAQLLLLNVILMQAEEMYVSVYTPATDIKKYRCDDTDAFVYTETFIGQLIAAAEFAGSETALVPESEYYTPKKEDAAKNALSAGFYSFTPENHIYKGEASFVTIGSAGDKYAESNLIALQIRNLIENEGVRCRDIAVVDRDGSYAQILTAALERYSIPCFTDKALPVTKYPVVKMMQSAVNIAACGWNTEEILNYLKSGVTPFTSDEISGLENYIYMWQTDSNKWTEPFTASVAGFSGAFSPEQKEEQDRKLCELEDIRQRLTGPLEKLRKALSERNPVNYCPAVWEFLNDVSASEHFCDYAQRLADSGNVRQAVECSGVWDRMTDILDAVHEAVKDTDISPVRFAEVFGIMLEANEMGRVPSGIDEVIISSADRIRLYSPAAVFLAGCNKGIFPAEITATGLFSTEEKRKLAEHELILNSTPEYKYADERIITHNVVCSDPDRLFVSYSARNISGEALEPSEIIEQIKTLFPKVKETSYEAIKPSDRVGSDATALREYASVYGKNNEEEANLRTYLEGSPYAAYFRALDAVVRKLPVCFESAAVATDLFGKTLRISASKAESYFKCAFSYFCRYGLQLEKNEIARLDKRIRGNLIHAVLENLLNDNPKEVFTAMSDNRLKEEISRYAEAYIEETFGGREDKNNTLNRSFDNTKDIIFDVAARMRDEFSHSEFTFAGMELDISDSYKADAKPYEIQLDDGGLLKITGKVDRADIYKNEEGTYIRIVDYKSGQKEFKAQEMLEGLNLQMPMYLFSLIRNGKAPFGGAEPAGFLYLPARADSGSLPREADRDATEQEIKKNGKLFGCILDNNEIVEAMNPEYLKISQKTRENLLSPKEFRGLEKQLTETLKDAGEKIHRGYTQALPAGYKADKLPCTYCAYYDICRREKNDEFRKPIERKPKEVAEILRNKEDEDDGSK